MSGASGLRPSCASCSASLGRSRRHGPPANKLRVALLSVLHELRQDLLDLLVSLPCDGTGRAIAYGAWARRGLFDGRVDPWRPGTRVHALPKCLAALARDAGCSGVVCSAHEVRDLKRFFGEDFLTLTPGIRPSGSAHADQKRVTTPAQAVEAGADYLVVGRPIVEAADPGAAAKAILEEMSVHA